MVLEILNAVPQQYSTVLLLILLMAAFIAAFKLLEMVFETIMISVLSAATYVAFTRLMWGRIPGLNDILLFAFAGASLYIGYTLLSSAYGIAAKTISIPYNIIKTTSEGLEEILSGVISFLKDRKQEKKQRQDEKEVKEVVLGKDEEDEKD
ncbi:MAG: hypothetical protein ABEK00_03645 [Candidatus Nanohaloarchaea archaeon]